MTSIAECPKCAAPAPEESERAEGTRIYSCASCHEAFLVTGSGDGIAVVRAIPPESLASRIAPGSVMEGVFACLDKSIEQLPTIPAAPQRVIDAANDPLTTSADLAQIINEDTSLSLRILRLTNSVAFAGREVTADMRLACARLGMRGVANVAHCVAQANIYRATNPIFRELMQELWKHAVGTARLAESLAAGAGNLPSRSIFLMGLVHDVGKVVLLDAITVRSRGRVGQLDKHWDLLMNVLDEFAPYAGLRVLQHWGLAQEIRFTTYYLASPSSAPPLYRKQTALIALASAVAELAGYGVTGKAQPDIRKLAEALHSEFKTDDLDQMIEEAKAQIAPYAELAVP